MNKIKMVFTTGAFALALVLSFAFKPATAKLTAAYIKNTGGVCTVPVSCIGSAKLCKFSTQQAFYDETACTIPAFQN